MKIYQKPSAEIVELKLEDVISASGQEEGGKNTGNSPTPFPPPHGEEGDQPAC